MRLVFREDDQREILQSYQFNLKEIYDVMHCIPQLHTLELDFKISDATDHTLRLFEMDSWGVAQTFKHSGLKTLVVHLSGIDSTDNFSVTANQLGSILRGDFSARFGIEDTADKCTQAPAAHVSSVVKITITY